MTLAKEREYRFNITPSKKDTFNAQVIITKDVAQYARQITVEIARIATDSLLTEKGTVKRRKKYGR